MVFTLFADDTWQFPRRLGPSRQERVGTLTLKLKKAVPLEVRPAEADTPWWMSGIKPHRNGPIDIYIYKGVWVPSGYVKIAVENGPVEIVDFPS